MKIIREIAGRIFALWAALIFVATMLLILLPFLLFSYFAEEPKKTNRWAAIARVWMGMYLPLIGCPLFVRGRKNFTSGETYIVVCNHNSLMDVPISYPAIPGGNKTIAKIEMAKIPIFGLMYRTGSILVDRKSDASRKESYLQMKKVLEMGLHMCLYPEGTRNLTDQPLKTFHDGAFRLAIDSGKAIIPSLIFNTRKVLPASKPFFLIPHKMEMHFLPPIPVQPGDTTQALKERVYKVMHDYYLANAKR
jgi:1-acyl-sn-glycerol-3-phosphate acyltransferase